MTVSKNFVCQSKGKKRNEMADSANTGGELNERDGMVVNWSDLTEDRLVVEVITQQQELPRKEPEAAVKLPDVTSPVLLLFLMQFSMILAVSRTSRVLLRWMSKHR